MWAHAFGLSEFTPDSISEMTETETPWKPERNPIDDFKAQLAQTKITEGTNTLLSLYGGRYSVPDEIAFGSFPSKYAAAVLEFRAQVKQRTEEMRAQYELIEEHERDAEVLKAQHARLAVLLNQRLTALMHPLFLVEVRTPVFRYFIDFDMEEATEDALPQELLLQYARTVQKVLRAFYPTREVEDASFRLSICRSNMSKRIPAKEEEGKPETFKHGFHYYAPELFLTTEQARDIRLSMLAEFERTYGPRPLHNTWDAVIDETVYVGSGLRLPFSYKASICRAMKPEQHRETDCAECHSSFGRKIEARCYEPAFAVCADGSVDAEETERLQDFEYAVRKLSIRTPRLPDYDVPTMATEGYALPPLAPRAPRENQLTRAAQKRLLNIKASPEGDDGEEARFTFEYSSAATVTSGVKNKHAQPCDREVFKQLLKFVQREFPHHSNIYFAQVHRCDTKTGCYYMCKAGGVGAHYCMNKGGEHNSSTVWFLVTRTGVFQKCFSRKPAKPSQECACGQYASPARPMDSTMSESLFPNKAKSTIGRAPVQSVFGQGHRRRTEHDRQIEQMREALMIAKLKRSAPQGSARGKRRKM